MSNRCWIEENKHETHAAHDGNNNKIKTADDKAAY